MADYQQNFLASLQGGLNLGQQLRGIQDRNQLNKLASQAYSTPTDQRDGLLSQMAGVDAQSAQQQEKAFANSDERRNTTMVNMAKLLTSAPEQARPQLWQRFIPTLSQYGLSDLPTEYNAQTAPIIDQAAQSLVQAYSGNGGASGVQSTYVDNNGQRVAIMRDGSTQILGGNDAGANQQTLTIDVNGTPTQVTFDRRTGRYTNASLGGQGAPQQPQPAAQGGYQQINGQQTYIDPSLPPQVQQQIRQSLAAGQEPPAQMAFAGDGGQAGTPLVGRRDEDRASAVESAKIEAQLAAAQRVAEAEANAARLKKEAEIEVQQQGERAAAGATRLRDAQETVAVLQEALPLLDTATGSGLGAIRDAGAAFVGRATDGAKANASLRVLATRLTAKVPRFEGPQSDKDVAEYKAAAGDLANESLPVEIRRAAGMTLQRLSQKAIAQAKAAGQGGGQGGNSQGRTIVRRGTSQGRPVIQYSDGTIEYGN
ncbi:hypothetical protein [Stenotrophomonas sp. BIGb0135]|uniref:hypothetical protein n=1 Tax=Stenotrophomonas sp. BIGb0135 TaxID=2940620 RepID=UPI0021693C0C|nr:hypothetical protein [Stenotrophomonas sp. BIGb0135]MCS4234408.1 hypothetical protein [Stenotrophomonas sp. BIGb0135]